jgi:hypothetical protein
MSTSMLRQFLNLLAAVRERPHDYCSSIGELDELLSQLYEVCAIAAGKNDAFQHALQALLASHGLTTASQLLSANERQAAFFAGDAAAEKVIAFWSELDEPLGFPSPLACCSHCLERLAQME